MHVARARNRYSASARENNHEREPHQNLAIIGHVDHGKITLVGRLLFETGSVPEHVIEQHQEEAEEKGKGGFEFAYVMDNLAEERERGVTIDIAHQEFDTDSYYFTIVDCPGHRDFVKNMITGASQADNAVLVVAADDGVAAADPRARVPRPHSGHRELIVAVNKMDLVDYGESEYKQVVEEVKTSSRSPLRLRERKFIPVSAFEGDNIAEESEHTGGTTAKSCSKHLTTCRHRSRRRTRRSACPFRTFTPSRVSVPSPSDVSRRVRSTPVTTSPSSRPTCPAK